MELTTSYRDVFPDEILEKYDFAETRNASVIFNSTNPTAFQQCVEVLRWFELQPADLITPGGQESNLAARLNKRLRAYGWREARVDTLIRLKLKKMPMISAGETVPVVVDTEQNNEGYKVDNFIDRVALDVEWNAKDGNLDRDISAYRALYDAALIDLGVILTRTQADLRQLGYQLGIDAGFDEKRAKSILGTTTTTNSVKLLPKMTRGDAGGCPLLAIFICARTLSK